MTVRATKRGDARTPLTGSWDVLVCGASFAGLAVARELAGADARVLLLDRYEIGERQTSACAAPTRWLQALDLTDAVRQTFSTILMHSPLRECRWDLPWTYSTFDYPHLCALLAAQGDATFDTATVTGRTDLADGDVVVHTDRGDLRAPLVVDALGWRRVLAAPGSVPVQPPDATLSRGLEVHPAGSGEHLELWLDPGYIPRGYCWSFPAGDEVRVGVGSYDPRDHVREPTVRLAADEGVAAERYQGNWIPHRMRDAVDGRVFFAGDSAGHCYPTTAEGIRPALHYGLALGRELRMVLDGRQVRAQALARYAELCEADRWKFEQLLRIQRLVGRFNPNPRAMRSGLGWVSHPAFVRWAFEKYLGLAPPPAHRG